MSLADVLPENWIDLSPGEAYVVREALLNQFDIPQITFKQNGYSVQLPHHNEWREYKNINNYGNPAGFAPLIKRLEEKHNAPVIITNGAKQALAAVFYALKQSHKNVLGFDLPVWGLIPSLAKQHGLDYHINKYDCFLSVMPNNPDGSIFSFEDGIKLTATCEEDKIPLIHDAAYYTPIYMPENYEYGPIGDIQIFSFSKMLGLSSLRLGYVVCKNNIYYRLIRDYIEMMTVGVCTYAQAYMAELLTEMHIFKHKTRQFVSDARDAMYKARFITKLINKDILSIPDNITELSGMFLWAKLLKKDAFRKAKINVLYGTNIYSKDDDYIRLNLAAPYSALFEAVSRLNNSI